MDLSKEIREFEAKGVFIHLQHEHYTNGSNCNWSIEFTRLPKDRGFDEKNNQTG
ncbi:MAG: hypothetical protein US96_C0029G0005 [Candidatus Woesebacteria bacterium GW2011_GWB1_38_5b]|uniref:Uncharacterized protein n=1 Tax=Candidatus Woesebacteria bacterium GW2011_GWB1_38_5b TaxID=1618569 RepID=A0A0G0NBZ1_9BACT|nr:MAG: hypothetical protein US96_C0029G0005 [Candidatus Woesebacteria bacterium GW2011_GWB1_38_5b]